MGNKQVILHFGPAVIFIVVLATNLGNTKLYKRDIGTNSKMSYTYTAPGTEH